MRYASREEWRLDLARLFRLIDLACRDALAEEAAQRRDNWIAGAAKRPKAHPVTLTPDHGTVTA